MPRNTLAIPSVIILVFPLLIETTLAQTPDFEDRYGFPASSAMFSKAAIDIDSLYWDNPFGIPGANGGVEAMVMGADSCLYVGGWFTQIGDTLANYVAKLDGDEWMPVGDGFNNAVLSLAADTLGNIYAGGWFTKTGGGDSLGTYGRVAKWDGATWSGMGDGLTHDVEALKFDPINHELYEVGGQLLSFLGQESVNRWNSGTESWDSLGAGIVPVADLTFDSSGRLYVGGSFTSIGDTAASGVAVFRNGKWEPLGTGVGGSSATVYALEMMPGDSLWVAGDFNAAGGVPTKDVALWASKTWHNAEISATNSVVVRDLFIDSGGTLWAGGHFGRTDVSSSRLGNVARRTGATSWVRDEANSFGPVYSLANGPDGNLFFGGFFGFVAGPGGTPFQGAANIASYDGIKSHNTVPHSFHSVRTIAADTLGGLYVGGDFRKNNGSSFDYIAYWNGTSWDSLGTGMDSTVYALTIALDGMLYAGGEFTTAGGTAANYVASWNGSSWSALGSGTSSVVHALEPGNGDTLFVGGYFATAGGISSPSAAGWDGSSWFGLGSGPPLAFSTPIIEELAYHPDGRLFAGRHWFGIDDRVFQFQSGTWSELGTDVRGDAMVIDDIGRLVAGSLWWTGSEWRSLEPGINISGINELMIDSSGVLYAGFSTSETFGSTLCYDTEVTFSRVTMFDGQCWHPLGSGIPIGSVLALAPGSVIVGGSFDLLGDGGEEYHLAAGLGRWKADASLVDFGVKVRVFLEGPYGSGQMLKTLNSGGHLESSAGTHPYSGSPWNNARTDSVASGFFASGGGDLVDWVHLKLFEGDPATTLAAVDSAVGLVSVGGYVFGLESTTALTSDSTVIFPLAQPGPYHLAVYHRNHLAAVSAVTVGYATTSVRPSYSFTESMGAAYGSSPLKDLGDGNFGLFGGDGSVDGQVTASDFNLWLVDTKAVATGYLTTDFDMDGQVTASDFNLWLVNTKAVAQAKVGF